LEGFAGGFESTGNEPLLKGVNSVVHEASTIEMVAPESAAPLALVASIARRPMGRVTVGAAGLVDGVAPGVVAADTDAVVSSDAQ
jgi:hypothetical protein